MAKSRRGFLVAGTAAGLFAGEAKALCALYPSADVMTFCARREGEDAGWLRLAFLRDGEGLLVRSDAELSLGRQRPFKQRVEEIWDGGWLMGLTADTWEAGTHYALRAERLAGGAGSGGDGGGLAGQAGPLRFNVSGYVVATTFWHRDTPFLDVLFSVVDGLTKVVSSRALPDETFDLAGRPVTARGWRLSGEWPCLLWYDEDCTLVRIALPDSRGRGTILERQS